MPVTLLPRQYYGDGWYYSDTAWIIKYVIIGVVLLLLLGFFGGGWLSARRRMAKGLKPKRWTKWCLTRQQKEQYFPSQRVAYHSSMYGHGPAMPLNNYGPAPPVYQETDHVPPYPGASKVNPDQTYQPPPGPPGPSQPPQADGIYR